MPGFHGGLRGRPDVQEMIRRWVRGADLEGSGLWIVVGRVIAGTRLGVAGARPRRSRRRRRGLPGAG